MLPVVPLIGAVADGLVIGSIAAEGAKYIQDSMSTPLRKPANNSIPTKTKLSNLGSKGKLKALSESASNTLAKQKNLSKYSAGVNAALAVAAGAIGVASSDSLNQIGASSEATKAANDATKSQFADSHFLKNQVDVKQSIDYLIDSINAQTVALFQAIAPLGLHLANLVTATNASTDAIIGLGSATAPAPTVNVAPAPQPVTVNVPTAPAPVVNVSPSPSPVVVESAAPTVNVNVPTAPAPTINVEAPIIPDYTLQLDRMADSADAVKEHHEYLKVPLPAPDTTTETGTTTLSPRDAAHAKNIHHARGEADENNIGGDLYSELEDLFDGDELNMLKIFGYTPINESFASLQNDDMSDFLAKLTARYNIT